MIKLTFIIATVLLISFSLGYATCWAIYNSQKRTKDNKATQKKNINKKIKVK